MLKIVPASERIDRLQFNPQVEYTDHVIHVGVYSCFNCKHEIEFNTGHLRRFENMKESPLGQLWDEKCNKIRPKAAWEWAMDFRCSQCNSPVRIIYGHDGEFSMGSCKYRILEVIESVDDESMKGV